MAIDPSIALSVRGPQIESPIDQMAKVLSLRDMMAQGQVRGLQLQQMKQAQQDEDAMRGAMRFGQDGALDRSGTLAELYKVAPQAAEKWRHTWAKEDADLQEAKAKGNKANIEQALKWNEAIASLTRGVKDQGTYTMALNRAKQLGIPGVDNMPAQYDQGFVQNLQIQALTAVDYYNSQKPQSDLARINADEAAGRISPQQAEAMRRKMTTHAPGTSVYTGTLVPAVDETGRSVFAMPSKDGSAKVVPGIAPPPKEKGKTRMDAEKLEAILGEAEPLIQQAPGSYLGAGVALGKRAFGVSDESTQAQSQLKALEAQLMMNMPRMEGPQSDRDVALYRQQAGAIGDPTVATGDKLAALRAIRSLAQKYKGVSESPAPKAAPGKPSLRPGTVEDGYVFNGGDPSDPRNWKKVR